MMRWHPSPLGGPRRLWLLWLWRLSSLPLRHLCRSVLLRFNPPLCPLWLQWKALGPLVGQLSWRSRMLLTVLMLCAS